MTLEQSTDLDDLMCGPEPDWDFDPQPPAGLDQATGMMRRLRRLEGEQNAAVELATTEHARVDLWLSVETDRLGQQIGHLKTALALYHEARLAEDPKAKTIRTPAGHLTARSQTYWVFTDEFLAWAELAAPHLVRQPVPPPAIDKKAAKTYLEVRDGRAVTVDGEVPPGVTVTEAVVFDAKPSPEVNP